MGARPRLARVLALIASAAFCSPVAADGFVGADTCRACHPIEAGHWAGTVHARLSGSARSEAEGRGCESCHGPGAAHVADPRRDTIRAFTHGSATLLAEQNASCLSCHSGQGRTFWPGSAHDSADVGCSDCHNPMAEISSDALLQSSHPDRVCFDCHPRERMEFRKRSHMPLHEGKIRCTSCHDPHGSVTDPLLRADSVNQLCEQCHAEKRGPFLWEHAPVRESCLNCHRPHGSNHPSLLARPEAFLCQQCHNGVAFQSFSHPNDALGRADLAFGSSPDERLIVRGCVNCHSRIHGSNHPAGARFHR